MPYATIERVRLASDNTRRRGAYTVNWRNATGIPTFGGFRGKYVWTQTVNTRRRGAYTINWRNATGVPLYGGFRGK